LGTAAVDEDEHRALEEWHEGGKREALKEKKHPFLLCPLKEQEGLGPFREIFENHIKEKYISTLMAKRTLC
jgi:hypothetical protein